MKKLDAKWYIVQVVSNHEQKVKEALESRDFTESKDNSTIKEVFLPMINHITKTGKIRRKPMFPGYLFVKLFMSDESWYIIRNTQFVTGIVGSSGQRTKPTPILEEQITKIIQKIQDESKKEISNKLEKKPTEKIVTSVNFKEGDIVEVKEGDFANQEGTVTSFSLIKQTVTVTIEFFGRQTSIELPLTQIIKK